MILNHTETSQTQRSWVRELIDPGGTLPNVVFKNKEYGHLKEPLHPEKIILLNGQPIGVAAIIEEGRNRHFGKITITKNVRPKGCGLAAYVLVIEEALKEGFDFVCDTKVSEDSVKIWEILAKKGVATISKKFSPILTEPKWFEGKYRVKERKG